MHARHWRIALVLCLLAPALLIAGCSGDDGAPGQDGADTGILSGTVTNSTTGLALAGAAITGDPAFPAGVVTDATGAYSVEVPVGAYMVYANATDFTGGSSSMSMLAGGTVTRNFALAPVSPVVVELTATQAAPTASVDFATTPGDTFVVSAAVRILDGSTLEADPYGWSAHGLAMPVFATPNLASTGVTLADAVDYKDALIMAIEEASMGRQPLQRFQVLPINPLALEEAGHVQLMCTVQTSSGPYTGTIDVHTTLPFANVSTGLFNQPGALPIMLQAPDQDAAYDWAIVDAPTGSNAALDDDTAQFPAFTPDMNGEYEIEYYNEAEDSTDSFTVYVGNWQGAIDTGASIGGRPVATCAQCHEDQADDWSESGHAEIFTDQINFGGHYSTGCFPCHTVGYNTTAANNGIDDQSDFQDFLDADYFHHNSADNWDTILADQPDTAQLANIQCENCHGPQGGTHTDGDARISLASEVCATCHGEPPRHARYQQWLESGHANYELAEDEGSSGNCSRCHTANGFIAWGEEYDWEGGNSVKVNWSTDEVHPQTCATCHPTHNVGTTSGHGTNAPMRIMGDTPMLEAGFQVFHAGKGAVCMTCHNSRRDFAGLNPADARAPHHSNQTDMLQSLGMFFVEQPTLPGKHSFVTDTCVACHVELTPPPAELSYNLGGTNHTFAAGEAICAECHGAFDGETLQANFENGLEYLEGLINESIEYQINDALGSGNDVFLAGYDSADSEDTIISTTIAVGTPFNVLHFGSSHGRQAMDIEVNGTVYYHVQLRKAFGSDYTAPTGTGHVVFPTGGDPDASSTTVYTYSFFGNLISQAGWNFLFVEFDGSLSIHNPTFAGNGLLGAITELEDWLND